MPASQKNHKAAARGGAGIFILWLSLFGLGQLFFCGSPPTALAEPARPSNTSPAEPGTPLSLDQVLNIALRQNPSLASLKNSLSSSELSLTSARSDFQIQITPTGSAQIAIEDTDEKTALYSAGVAVSRKFSTGTQVAVTPMVGRLENGGGSRLNSLDIELTQPLFRGISPEFNLSAIRSSELNVRSARRRYFLGQVDVLVQTVAGFYNVLLQEKLVENHRQSATRLEAFARSSGIKRKVGLAGAEDEFRANQRLQQARDDLVASQQALQLAQDNLKRLLDWPTTDPIHIDGDLTIFPVFPDESQAVAAALENRAEIDEARDLLKEAFSLSRDARHRLLPRLDISLSYTTYDRESPLDKELALDESRWGISLITSTDIFKRTEKAGYEKSLLTIEDSQRNLSTLEEDIVRQVRENIRNLNESASRIELQENRVKEAEKQLSLSRFKFKYGMTDNFDLLDAESVLNSAQGSVDSARARYIVGVYRLRAAMGTLLQNPERTP